MGIASTICGALGLVLVFAGVSFGAGLFFAGLALGVIAVVLGFFDRKKATGKAGLALGALVLVGTALLFFMLKAAPSTSTISTVPSTTPAMSVPRP